MLEDIDPSLTASQPAAALGSNWCDDGWPRSGFPIYSAYHDLNRMFTVREPRLKFFQADDETVSIRRTHLLRRVSVTVLL